MREMAEIKKYAIDIQVISTRRPKNIASRATHSWADEAETSTKYLIPLTLKSIFLSTMDLLLAGPNSLSKVASVIYQSELSFKDKLRHCSFVILAAQLKRYSNKKAIEHIHVHSCANTANIALYTFLLGGPSYSMTLHGPLRDYGNNQVNKWKNASFGIVITQDLHNELAHIIGSKSLPKLYIAPMGVNIDKFSRQHPYTPPVLNEKIKLISCGRINRIKGHDDLIKATAILVNEKGLNVELTICGAADSKSEASGYLEELISLSKKNKIENRIKLVGSIPEERLIEELESAHIFCLASHKEPLGVAIMEAMAMEVPVIVTQSPGTKEMISSNIDGILVEPKQPKQFSDKIFELINTPHLLLQLSEKARQTVSKRFHSGLSAEVIATQSARNPQVTTNPNSENH